MLNKAVLYGSTGTRLGSAPAGVDCHSSRSRVSPAIYTPAPAVFPRSSAEFRGVPRILTPVQGSTESTRLVVSCTVANSSVVITVVVIHLQPYRQTSKTKTPDEARATAVWHSTKSFLFPKERSRRVMAARSSAENLIGLNVSQSDQGGGDCDSVFVSSVPGARSSPRRLSNGSI